MQHPVKIMGGETVTQRFWTKATEDLKWVYNQPDAPKFARVIEGQPHAVLQIKHQSMVWSHWICLFFNQQIAAHSQVDQ
jgi:hypothetical protein